MVRIREARIADHGGIVSLGRAHGLYPTPLGDFRHLWERNPLVRASGRDWPQGWVIERDYAAKNLEESLESFLEERKKSIAWLRGLKSPAWDSEKTFDNGWSPKAGDIFAAWVAHDILHIRQLAKLHYEYICHLADPYEVDYAGDW